jgi:hypothetical protein
MKPLLVIVAIIGAIALLSSGVLPFRVKRLRFLGQNAYSLAGAPEGAQRPYEYIHNFSAPFRED